MTDLSTDPIRLRSTETGADSESVPTLVHSLSLLNQNFENLVIENLKKNVL